jgi:hypothetical protein
MTARKAASNLDLNGLKVTNLGTPTAASNDAARQADVETAYAAAISRANHTGSQLAVTVSDFDTQVRLSRLDQMAAPTASVGMNGQQIINVLDPTTAQAVATRNYVDTTVAGLATGQVLKGTVRAVALTNVSVTAAPATIDGITPASGDVFLLAGQTTGSENGPRVWTGAGAAMARAGNWDSTAEAVVGSYWIVREGSQADKFALMTNDTFATLNTTVPAFIYIGVATASTTAVEQDCGNGALTSFAITHSFGTRAVNVAVYRVASPYDEVDVYVEHTDVNTVTVKPDAVWSTNEFHVVVSKS